MSIIITMTGSAAADMIMNSMSIIITTTESVAADMIMKSMSIIITMTESAAADMITSMSTTIMTESVVADMTTTIIMQMRSSQAGAVRLLKNIHVRDLRRSLRHFPSLINTVSSSVQRECFRQKTEHGSILIWFRKKLRSVRVHRNIQAVCV